MQGSSLALLQDLKSPHFDEVVAIYIYIYVVKLKLVQFLPCLKLKIGPFFIFEDLIPLPKEADF